MSRAPSNDAVALIAGAVEVPYSRRSTGETTSQLLARAVQQLLRKAGMTLREVDGLGVASFTHGPDNAIDLAWRLGLTLSWCMDDRNGGASAINMLQHAVRAIQHGDANVIVLVAGDTFTPEDFKTLVDDYNVTTRDYLKPLQHGGPNGVFAMLTQRHAEKTGLGRKDYAQLCIAQRAWAQRNPQAVYREPLTLQHYLDAPMVADPLCRFDCVPVVNGANAILLTRADLAPGGVNVAVRALKARFNHDHQAGDGLQTSLAEIANPLWDHANAGPEAMDLVCVYDDYPAMTLIQLNDLGFVPGGDYQRALQRIGRFEMAVNTSGGQLSAGQAGAAGGMHGLVEAIIQLRSEAGERQVSNARLAAVTGYGMVEYRYGMCANAVVLERWQGGAAWRS
jgi:acetyl-CoA acetyltransferase